MEAVLVAVIGAVGVVLASMIASLRKENHEDHAVVSNSLNRIENKIDNHIDSHAKGQM
jgi:sensor domain CHASE-containing protein